MKTIAFFLATLVPAIVSAQETPTVSYAPVNGLKMYYEVHISEMFRLKGGDVLGDIQPRSASRLAILPNTTHVSLMERMAVIVPMVNDFLDAKPLKQ